MSDVNVDVLLRVNGAEHALRLDPRTTLLDALRDHLHLTGTKKGCDMGQCGACTVIVDGRRIVSCLTLAVMESGHEVTTVEGLARGEELHPVQRAFLEHDGLQCGYCTPGQIMSAVALLDERCGPDDVDVREAMSGNLCRCGAHPGIIAAVQQARTELGRSGDGAG
ncbi:MAG: (2Fe-2S)-binding protein [Candidatus Dormibacteria bacterium]